MVLPARSTRGSFLEEGAFELPPGGWAVASQVQRRQLRLPWSPSEKVHGEYKKYQGISMAEAWKAGKISVYFPNIVLLSWIVLEIPDTLCPSCWLFTFKTPQVPPRASVVEVLPIMVSKIAVGLISVALMIGCLFCFLRGWKNTLISLADFNHYVKTHWACNWLHCNPCPRETRRLYRQRK